MVKDSHFEAGINPQSAQDTSLFQPAAAKME